MTGLEIIALASLIGGTGMSLYQQGQSRKDAKKAQEEQKRQDAWSNLISIVGGRGPTGMTPVSVAPQVDYAGALSTLGQGAAGVQSSMNASKEAAWLKQLKADQLAAQIPAGQTSPQLGIPGVKAPTSSSAKVPWAKAGRAGFIGDESGNTPLARLQQRYSDALTVKGEGGAVSDEELKNLLKEISDLVLRDPDNLRNFGAAEPAGAASPWWKF